MATVTRSFSEVVIDVNDVTASMRSAFRPQSRSGRAADPRMLWVDIDQSIAREGASLGLVSRPQEQRTSRHSAPVVEAPAVVALP